MKWPDRKCIVCERVFTPTRRDKIYCGGACRQWAWRNGGAAAAKDIFIREKPFAERRK